MNELEVWTVSIRSDTGFYLQIHFSAQETYIETLTNQLDRLNELTRDGHINPLQLFTRESMDIRIAQANARLQEKDDTIARISATAHELQQTGKSQPSIDQAFMVTFDFSEYPRD